MIYNVNTNKISNKMGGGSVNYFGMFISEEQYHDLKNSDVYDKEYVHYYPDMDPSGETPGQCVIGFLSEYKGDKKILDELDINCKLDKDNKTVTLNFDDLKKLRNNSFYLFCDKIENELFPNSLKYNLDAYIDVWNKNEKIKKICEYLNLESNPEHTVLCYNS